MTLGNFSGARPSLHFATPVWGHEYIRVFLDTALPTLLAPGNLPVLVSGAPRCIYRIFTSREGMDQIRSHPSFARLVQLLPVEFVDIDSLSVASEGHPNKYSLMTEAYNEALRRSRGAASVFLNADMVFADGSFANLLRIIDTGKRAIEIVGFRIDKIAAERTLHSEWKKSDGTICIPPRALVALSLRNMHRISRKHFWPTATNAPFLPFHTYWKVGDHGLVARATHLYPLFVYPEKDDISCSIAIDWDLLDQAISGFDSTYVVADSDILYSCELSDPEYDIEAFVANSDHFVSMCAFVGTYCSKRHRATLHTAILIHEDNAVGFVWQWTRWKTKLWVYAITMLALPGAAYNQIRVYGLRAIPALVVYAMLLPFVSGERARYLAKTVRDNRRGLPAMIVFAVLAPIAGPQKARRIAKDFLDGNRKE
jgi:hypothetical protein